MLTLVSRLFFAQVIIGLAKSPVALAKQPAAASSSSAALRDQGPAIVKEAAVVGHVVGAPGTAAGFVADEPPRSVTGIIIAFVPLARTPLATRGHPHTHPRGWCV
jgi:hypothetical protein